ncbi:hypothetical protein [Leifsonia sp. Leaf336]|uniref:hypothetical protein n=1 Tax=Leifsonia sp. Leaf336 TaxID=1736341 RepID=UPI0012FAB172|nr:hypothetical protein [Leifsonia sp. Leaf336]
MQREVSDSGRMNLTKRASWIVRFSQTNQYNWIVLVFIGSAIGVLGVLSLIAGKVPGSLFALFYGAITAGPAAWRVRRATRIPAQELQSEADAASWEEPQP